MRRFRKCKHYQRTAMRFHLPEHVLRFRPVVASTTDHRGNNMWPHQGMKLPHHILSIHLQAFEGINAWHTFPVLVLLQCLRLCCFVGKSNFFEDNLRLPLSSSAVGKTAGVLVTTRWEVSAKSVERGSLSQQPDGAVLGAQQQQPLGGQHRQAGQRAAEVLRAQFCAADGALGDVGHGVNPDLVGHRPRHDLGAVQVEGVDGFRLRPVLAQRLGLQVLPHGEGVVGGRADDQVAFCSLKCTFQGTFQSLMTGSDWRAFFFIDLLCYHSKHLILSSDI